MLRHLETEPGQAFSVWYESAEVRMGLPSEELFYPDEPTLAAARLAYLEANRAALGDGPQGRGRGRRGLLRVLLILLAILLLASVRIPVYPIRTPTDLERLFQEFRSDLKTGRYEEARALMTQRMKEEPAFSVHIRNSYPTLQEQLAHRDSYFLDRCRSNLFFTRCGALYVGESRFGIASSVYPVYTTVSFRRKKDSGSWTTLCTTTTHPLSSPPHSAFIIHHSSLRKAPAPESTPTMKRPLILSLLAFVLPALAQAPSTP